MTVIIEPTYPKSPNAAKLLLQSQKFMQKLYSNEENLALSVEQLCAPHIQFFIAREYDVSLGCGALMLCEAYVEVKSLFVLPFARGQGVAAKLIRRIELEARLADHSILRLETGQELKAAMALYKRLGFTTSGPFGSYKSNSASVFMEKKLV